jgi:hypothetical protein
MKIQAKAGKKIRRVFHATYAHAKSPPSTITCKAKKTARVSGRLQES